MSQGLSIAQNGEVSLVKHIIPAWVCKHLLYQRIVFNVYYYKQLKYSLIFCSISDINRNSWKLKLSGHI